MTAESLLLHEIAAGNQKAFQELFESRKEKIFNYLFRVVKSKEVTEEILIDVFVKVWMVKEMLQEIQNIDAFLHTIAHHKALDFLKLASRNPTLQTLIEWEMVTVQSKEADHQLIENDYQHLLGKAIEQLSPQRRTVFNLSRTDGLSYKEIAVHLRVTSHTVRNTMSESLKSIRKYLGGNGLYSAILLCFSLLLS